MKKSHWMTLGVIVFLSTALAVGYAGAPVSQESKVPGWSKALAEAEHENSVLVSEFLRERAEFHAVHGTEKNIFLLQKYLSSPQKGVARPSPDEAKNALHMLFQTILAYPHSLRGTISEDPKMVGAFEVLGRMGGDKYAYVLPGPRATVKEKDDALTVKHLAMIMADESMAEFGTHFVDGVVRELKVQGSLVAALNAHFFRTFFEVARERSDIMADPQYLLRAARMADHLFASLRPEFDKDDLYANLALLFIAESGNVSAQSLLAQKIASGKMKIETFDFYHMKQGDVRPVHLDKVYQDPRLTTVGRVGETVARQVLLKWGIEPRDYLDYWLRVGVPAKQFHARNDAVILNLRAIQVIELAHPGGTKKLTKEYGIRFPGRYPAEILFAQLKDDADEKYPFYGAILTAYADENGAFNESDDIVQVWKDAHTQGLSTRVVEAGDAPSAAERLLALTTRSGKKIEFLGVRGHGTEKSVKIGDNDGERFLDEYFLGIGPDRTALILRAGAPIYFLSCSTGVRDGIAERFSQQVQGEVTAPDLPTNIKDIALGRDTTGKLFFSVVYSDTKPHVETTANTYRGGKLVRAIAPSSPRQNMTATPPRPDIRG